MSFTNLTSMCSAQVLPYPTIPGVEFLSMTTTPVYNYTTLAADYYNYNHPNITVNTNFCNVTLGYTHPGENDLVYAEAWLPLDGWNERLQATGGGGWIAGRFFLSYVDMAGAVEQGFVAITTDAGLGTSYTASTWAWVSDNNVDLYALQNLGTMSLHEQSLIGKDLANSFYGQQPIYSYFSGCSQGGRQGLMLAQRFPHDYDGIAASAPANWWNELVFNVYWPTLIMNMLGEYPAPCEFDALYLAAQAYCDAADGVVDGVVSTLYNCDFDPMTLVGETINCSTTGTTRTISEAAAIVANATWEGMRKPDGEFLWYGVNYDADLSGDNSISGYALDTTACSSNGTCTADPSNLATDWIYYFVERNLDFNLENLTLASFYDIYHAGKQNYDSLISAFDPDLSGFNEAGGKLIAYHGLADTVIPPGGSIHYYNEAVEVTPSLDDFYRLFMIPGLSHCSGGVGGQPTTTFDALRAWVENGTAPETLPIQWTAKNTTFQREICKFPQETVYDGSGDPALASSFICQ